MKDLIKKLQTAKWYSDGNDELIMKALAVLLERSAAEPAGLEKLEASEPRADLKTELEYEKLATGAILFSFNGIPLGKSYEEVDGFYVFTFQKSNSGTWSGWTLRAIADKVDDLNKPWQETIDNDPAITRPSEPAGEGEPKECPMCQSVNCIITYPGLWQCTVCGAQANRDEPDAVEDEDLLSAYVRVDKEKTQQIAQLKKELAEAKEFEGKLKADIEAMYDEEFRLRTELAALKAVPSDSNINKSDTK